MTLEGRVPVSPRRADLQLFTALTVSAISQDLLSPWFPWSFGLLGYSESKLDPLGQTMTYISFQCVIFKSLKKASFIFVEIRHIVRQTTQVQYAYS